MAEKIIQNTTLQNLGNAIRSKTGGTTALTPSQMVTAINGIQLGDPDAYGMLCLAKEYTSLGSKITFSSITRASDVWDIFFYTWFTLEGNSYVGVNFGNSFANHTFISGHIDVANWKIRGTYVPANSPGKVTSGEFDITARAGETFLECDIINPNPNDYASICFPDRGKYTILYRGA